MFYFRTLIFPTPLTGTRIALGSPIHGSVLFVVYYCSYHFSFCRAMALYYNQKVTHQKREVPIKLVIHSEVDFCDHFSSNLTMLL